MASSYNGLGLRARPWRGFFVLATMRFFFLPLQSFGLSICSSVTPALGLLLVSYLIARAHVVTGSILWSTVLAGAMALVSAGAAMIFDSTSEKSSGGFMFD